MTMVKASGKPLETGPRHFFCNVSSNQTSLSPQLSALVGGAFALYSLIARYIGFTPGLQRGTPDVADQRLERYSSTVVPAGKAGRH